MKHYNTAKEILEASLAEIENGHWTCSILAKSHIGDLKFDGYFIPKDDPMGCALGLIAVHGGHGESKTLEVKGEKWESFIPAYPSEPAWYGSDEDGNDVLGPNASAAVIEARNALVRASGRPVMEDGDGDEPVYGFNDGMRGDPKGPERAAQWFRDALALIDAPVAA
jgi:hypothetical protein